MSSRDFLFPFICFSQSERSPGASWTLCEPHIGIHFTKVHLILVVCSVILMSSRLSHRVCKLLAHVIRVLVLWASCPCPVLPELTAGRLALWHRSCVLGRRPIPLLRHPALHLLCSGGLELGVWGEGKLDVWSIRHQHPSPTSLNYQELKAWMLYFWPWVGLPPGDDGPCKGE